MKTKTALYRVFMKCRKYLPRWAKLMINRLHFKVYGCKMPWSLLKFEVHLTDKCNLNCKGCMHFSCLCEETNLLDIHTYENDCKRISELTKGRIDNILLLGGEPLLHPNVKDFLIITRKYFPEISIPNRIGIIDLVTNGILLHKQSDDFWETCRDNSIRVVISDYPIKIKHEIIKEKAKKFNVELWMYSEKRESQNPGSSNQWMKIPIDTKGSHNNRKSFGKCFLGGNCFQLVNGKIFKCARIAYIDLFNAAFDKQLKVRENDYVDIYKTETIDEILLLLTQPAPFCRYCNVDSMTWNNEWNASKKTIDEWV